MVWCRVEGGGWGGGVTFFILLSAHQMHSPPWRQDGMPISQYSRILPTISKPNHSTNNLPTKLCYQQFQNTNSPPIISKPNHSTNNFQTYINILPTISKHKHSTNNFQTKPFYQQFLNQTMLPTISKPLPFTSNILEI